LIWLCLMSLTCNAAVRRWHMLEIDISDNGTLAWMDCALVYILQVGRRYKNSNYLRVHCLHYFSYYQPFHYSNLSNRPRRYI
jgi:hypothetical protein